MTTKLSKKYEIFKKKGDEDEFENQYYFYVFEITLGAYE